MPSRRMLSGKLSVDNLNGRCLFLVVVQPFLLVRATVPTTSAILVEDGRNEYVFNIHTWDMHQTEQLLLCFEVELFFSQGAVTSDWATNEAALTD